MKQMLFISALMGMMLTSCDNTHNTGNDMTQELELTEEWDKVFPLSEKVSHRKVTFATQYGQTLAADLYTPKCTEGKLPAIAVSGPFGAVKEQSSGLYAMKMAERGFVALAFDPSYTGESSGEPNPNPENKQLLIIPDATHCDLYDGGYEKKAGKAESEQARPKVKGQPKNMIPWDKLAEFFRENLK